MERIGDLAGIASRGRERIPNSILEGEKLWRKGRDGSSAPAIAKIKLIPEFVPLPGRFKAETALTFEMGLESSEQAQHEV
jgi:hypothetical protein